MYIERSHVPFLTAALHGVLFAATVVYVYMSSAGQAAMVWVYWIIVDLPISLLYFAAPVYSRFFHNTVSGHILLEQVLYFPHVVHGLLGTAWWYLMPRAIIRMLQRRVTKHG